MSPFRPQQLIKFIGFINALVFLTSCGANNQANHSAPLARVTQSIAERAFEVVAKIDYLPFANVADGCYARAYVIAMELAAERIPSSVQYAAASGAGSHLSPSPGVR